MSLLVQKQKKKFYILSTYNLLGKSQISLQVDAFKKGLLECMLNMCLLIYINQRKKFMLFNENIIFFMTRNTNCLFYHAYAH